MSIYLSYISWDKKNHQIELTRLPHKAFDVEEAIMK